MKKLAIIPIILILGCSPKMHKVEYQWFPIKLLTVSKGEYKKVTRRYERQGICPEVTEVGRDSLTLVLTKEQIEATNFWNRAILKEEFVKRLK